MAKNIKVLTMTKAMTPKTLGQSTLALLNSKLQ